ncbi:hypothetical protein TNCV_3333041 [Trichonephila clavipes]|nr:hypothetical protein TNCV_3333041 [Trichonephila clavipes]
MLFLIVHSACGFQKEVGKETPDMLLPAMECVRFHILHGSRSVFGYPNGVRSQLIWINNVLLYTSFRKRFLPSCHNNGFEKLFPSELKELHEIPANGFFGSLRHKQMVVKLSTSASLNASEMAYNILNRIAIVKKSASGMKEIILDVHFPKRKDRRVVFQCEDDAWQTSEPLMDACKSVPMATYQKRVESLPRRVQAVIDAKGGPTTYILGLS